MERDLKIFESIGDAVKDAFVKTKGVMDETRGDLREAVAHISASVDAIPAGETPWRPPSTAA